MYRELNRVYWPLMYIIWRLECVEKAIVLLVNVILLLSCTVLYCTEYCTVHYNRCLCIHSIQCHCHSYVIFTVIIVASYNVYMSCEIKQNLGVNYTKLRLSSHKFLVERAKWCKVKIPYAQRTCTLCSSGDIEDEYHIILICENFRDVRLKYIGPFYHNRPSMFKFVELMNTTNKRDRFKLMLFLKIVFDLYGKTLWIIVV